MDFLNRSVLPSKCHITFNADLNYTRSPLWKKKSAWERYHIYLVSMIFMITISVGVCEQDLGTGGENENTCTTPGCIAASSISMYKIKSASGSSYSPIAKFIQRNMDKNANPCDNFYQFACGGFKKTARIPDGRTFITTFSRVEELLANHLKSILSRPSYHEEIRPYALAKGFYAACMNKEKIEKSGISPLIKLLIRLGGWPLQDKNWNESSFNWEQTIAQFRKEGLSVSYLIDFMVDSDLKKSSAQVIELDEPALELEREELLKGIKDENNAKYLEYMVDVAEIFGADRNKSLEEQRQVLKFEIDLAKITHPEEERQDYKKLHNPMRISEMQKKFPSIQWLEYINNILAPSNKVNASEVIVVNSPDFIASLETLLQRTPKRILANYLMWRVVESSINFVSEFLRVRQQELNTTLNDNKPEARWRECVDIVSDRLQLAVGSMYVKSHFKKECKEKAQEMVANIRQEMYETINTVDWMDETTKKTALNKAHNLISLVGYPEEVLSDEELIKYYKELEIDPDEFFLSSLNLTKFETNYVFSKLKDPFIRGDWVEYGDLDSVDVIYYDWTNTLQISAAVLQPPFFYLDGPRYLDYGASGYLTAFQMTHAFDEQGCNHDKEGNLMEWWDDTTKKQFSQKAQCFVDQYGNYSVEELGGTKLSGMNTQTENIADSGAAKISYRAYRKWVQKNPIEPKLPNLQNFTNTQMFWISTANTWCANYKPEDLMSRLTSDEFAPGEFRVIGTFSNQEDFANDFNCPAGSNMNPIKKCKMW